ncbi:unnamed protein product [Caenorhabditis bovis]|uniref:Uncharacterized protein n=1 Tax=Caenorhabditis bovis TaxID=2654633 RepID=A0A8S1EGP5_9PELO|nr:unnamed protein product [Caenorhabditis bovis]
MLFKSSKMIRHDCEFTKELIDQLYETFRYSPDKAVAVIKSNIMNAGFNMENIMYYLMHPKRHEYFDDAKRRKYLLLERVPGPRIGLAFDELNLVFVDALIIKLASSYPGFSIQYPSRGVRELRWKHDRCSYSILVLKTLPHNGEQLPNEQISNEQSYPMFIE